MRTVSETTTPDGRDERPRVSVVIAMFERRERSVACARSLAAQTIDRAEIIFVDDGSEDDTPEAVEAIAAGSRIPMRVLRNDRNLGANASRNRGVAAANAPLVAFLDSDCEASPEKDSDVSSNPNCQTLTWQSRPRPTGHLPSFHAS